MSDRTTRARERIVEIERQVTERGGGSDSRAESRELRQLHRLLARVGDEDSQNQVGVMFDPASEGRTSRRLALRWYRRSARQGNWGAMMNIASLFAQEGAPERAMRWYRRANRRWFADTGEQDGEALVELAKLFATAARPQARARLLLKRALSTPAITPEGREEAEALLAQLRRARRTAG